MNERLDENCISQTLNSTGVIANINSITFDVLFSPCEGNITCTTTTTTTSTTTLGKKSQNLFSIVRIFIIRLNFRM